MNMLGMAHATVAYPNASSDGEAALRQAAALCKFDIQSRRNLALMMKMQDRNEEQQEWEKQSTEVDKKWNQQKPITVGGKAMFL